MGQPVKKAKTYPTHIRRDNAPDIPIPDYVDRNKLEQFTQVFRDIRADKAKKEQTVDVTQQRRFY